MTRKNKVLFQDGDILLFNDGDMSEVVECNFSDSSMVILLSMLDDEPRLKDANNIDGDFVNLGQEPKTRALFHATRSIHVRLNKLNKGV